MKVNEFIKKITDIKNKYGDIEVYILPYYCKASSHEFKFAIPNDDEEPCVFIAPQKPNLMIVIFFINSFTFISLCLFC